MAEEKKLFNNDMVEKALNKMMPDTAIDTDEKIKQMLEW